MIVLSLGEHLGQRALTQSVGAYNGMDLAGLHLKIDAAQDLMAGGTQLTDPDPLKNANL